MVDVKVKAELERTGYAITGLPPGATDHEPRAVYLDNKGELTNPLPADAQAIRLYTNEKGFQLHHFV